MAAKTRWHRYGTKLRHCHRMYKTCQEYVVFFDSRCIMLYAVAPTRHQLGSQYYFSASFIHREFLPVQSVAPCARYPATSIVVVYLICEAKNAAQQRRLRLAAWRIVVSGVRRINEVNQSRVRLVLGRVTVFGRAYHLVM